MIIYGIVCRNKICSVSFGLLIFSIFSYGLLSILKNVYSQYFGSVDQRYLFIHSFQFFILKLLILKFLIRIRTCIYELKKSKYIF